MAHPIFKLAIAERERALEEFKKLSPFAYAAFLRAEQTMETYRDVPAVADALSAASQAAATIMRGTILTVHGGKLGVIPRAQSEAARVVSAAEIYVRKESARRTSRQITEALLAQNIEIGGNDLTSQIARVSAHLSASSKFNNDRSEGGYGLSEWPVSTKTSAFM